MTTNEYLPGQPPPKVRLALMMNRLKIEACIQAALYHALILPYTGGRRGSSGKPDEVSVLIHFFALLPDLEQRLNELLNMDGVDVQIKGVFCHKSGCLGMLPPSLNDPSADIGFGNAIYRMMEGSLGIAVGRPQAGDFRWDRIVHDVVLRAINEPLGDTRGIVGLDDLMRAGTGPDWLVNSGTSLVKNPFRKLAEAFGTQALEKAARRHAEKENRISMERFQNRDANANGEGPPIRNDEGPGPEESGSSGSFIQIQLSSR